MKSLHLLLLFVFLSPILSANDIDKAWAALNKNDRKEARRLFEACLKVKPLELEASIGIVLMDDLESVSGERLSLKKTLLELEDPNPYIFALWTQNAVVGNIYELNAEQVDFLEKMVLHPRVNESIKAGARYVLGFYNTQKLNVELGNKYYSAIGALSGWQLTGLFDNTSGSGFAKNYPPVTNPSMEAKFQSATHADVQWFTPKSPQNDGWFSPDFHFGGNQGVMYAQTFVQTPNDQEVVVSVGVSGSFRLWVNDQLALEEEEERRTELDTYSRKVKLKRGFNRIVVQLGYTRKSSYPCFMVRLLDTNFAPIASLKGIPISKPYTKNTEADLGQVIPHFADIFFKQKMSSGVKTPLNVFLGHFAEQRFGDFRTALDLIQDLEPSMPDNVLLHYHKLGCYNNLENTVERSKQMDKVKEICPDLPELLPYYFGEELDLENYHEADSLLNRIALVYGNESYVYYTNLIRYQSAKQDYVSLIKTINQAYKKFPDDENTALYKYSVLKNENPDLDASLMILRTHIRKTRNYRVMDILIDNLKEAGRKSEQEKYLLLRHEWLPQHFEFANSLVSFYFIDKKYEKSLSYIDKMLANAPYMGSLWYDRGLLLEAMGKKDEAIKEFQKSIYYNPNNFDAREKLRVLQGKKPLISLFKRDNAYDLIAKSLNKGTQEEDNFEYIFSDRNLVLYPEGASMEYNVMAVKVNNAEGVKYWKESNIGYHSGTQRLIIEKAETIKKNGQKIAAERDGAEIVFVSLEPGDAVHVLYKLETYSVGKLNQEFWSQRIFDSSIPIRESVLRFLAPSGKELNFTSANLNQEPKITTVDEFTLREWAMSDLSKIKDEPFSPNYIEIGKSLQFSTIKSWKTIAEWYRDLAMPLAKDDHIVEAAHQSITGGKTFANDYEKARAIYEYMCKNLRYSSVSFRQGSHVPQKPATTLSSQLGDCKDFSLLYHTLAKKSGIKTQLVLVNTKGDNGENDLKVPSIGFDHCIIRIDLADGPMYQELTSEYLPFGSIPHTLKNAQALVIPVSETEAAPETCIQIPYKPLYQSEVDRKTTVTIKGSNIQVQTALTATGPSAGARRYKFSGLTPQKTKEEMERILARPFTNNFIAKDHSLENVDNTEPTFGYKGSFAVESEVKNAGGLKLVKVPFYEVIATIDRFPDEERTFPLEYWKYEDEDVYRSEVTFVLPEGASLVEVPGELVIKNEFIDYVLKSEKLSTTSVKITRTVHTKRGTIPANQYKDFRETIRQIVTAEDSYVVFR